MGNIARLLVNRGNVLAEAGHSNWGGTEGDIIGKEWLKLPARGCSFPPLSPRLYSNTQRAPLPVFARADISSRFSAHSSPGSLAPSFGEQMPSAILRFARRGMRRSIVTRRRRHSTTPRKAERTRDVRSRALSS